MPRHGKRKSKNFGYGDNIKYATKNALHSHYGGGRFQTAATHIERINLFYDWLHKEHGVRDARKITNEVLLDYVLYIKFLLNEYDIKISTAVNRISSANVCLEIMRGDKNIRIDKISEALGEKRRYIRKSIPDGMDIKHVEHSRNKLESEGYHRAAAIIWLARTTGMRLRECSLADLSRLQREAKMHNKINIQDGCKGGRSGAFAPRWIPVTEDIVSALDYAIKASPKGSKNLLEADETYIKFIRAEINPARQLMKLNGINGPHELRAAYACDRYTQLVGILPPVFIRQGITPKNLIDSIRSARQIISLELGHNRPEIANSYVGSEYK